MLRLKDPTIANLFTSPAISSPTITTDVATSLDLNDSTLILDADADTTITNRPTDDQIDIKIVNTNHLQIKKFMDHRHSFKTNRSDAKDIIIQQFDDQ